MKGKTVFLATDINDNEKVFEDMQNCIDFCLGNKCKWGWHEVAYYPKETRRPWLENAIEEYIKNNSNKDSVDIVEHFKLSADITLNSLSQLTAEGRVVRKHLFGSNYSYRI